MWGSSMATSIILAAGLGMLSKLTAMSWRDRHVRLAAPHSFLVVGSRASCRLVRRPEAQGQLLQWKLAAGSMKTGFCLCQALQRQVTEESVQEAGPLHPVPRQRRTATVHWGSARQTQPRARHDVHGGAVVPEVSHAAGTVALADVFHALFFLV